MYKLKVVIHLIVLTSIIFLMFFSYYHLKNTLFLPIAICFLIAELYSLFSFLNQTNKNLTKFLESMEYSDFTQTFPTNNLNSSFNELNKTFMRILEKFKNNRIEKERNIIYFNTILQYINIGIINIEKNGNVQFANKAAKEILNFNFIRNLDNLLNINKEIHSLIENIRHGEKLIKEVKVGNELKQLSISGFKFKIEENEYTLLCFQDIHNVLEENEMEAWQKLLRVLTHEIMNSLTPISSLSATSYQIINNIDLNNVIEKEQLEGIKNALTTIDNRSQGLIEFVNAYRKMGLIPKPQKKVFFIKDLIQSSLETLRNEIASNNISIVENYYPNSIKINADYVLIQQVIINLLVNALHAVTEEKHPVITIKSFINENGKQIIAIEDNGCGIPENSKGKIFIPFYSTKNSSGVGLSLCKQIMRLHRGNITAKSENNKTIFTLFF